jgi:hypothetical protein
MGSSPGGATDDKFPVEAAPTAFTPAVGAMVKESPEVDASSGALILSIWSTEPKIK